MMNFEFISLFARSFALTCSNLVNLYIRFAAEPKHRFGSQVQLGFELKSWSNSGVCPFNSRASMYFEIGTYSVWFGPTQEDIKYEQQLFRS